MSFRFEIQLGIIAACAPALRPGWKWLGDRANGRKTSSASGASSRDYLRNKEASYLPSTNIKGGAGSTNGGGSSNGGASSELGDILQTSHFTAEVVESSFPGV